MAKLTGSILILLSTSPSTLQGNGHVQSNLIMKTLADPELLINPKAKEKISISQATKPMGEFPTVIRDAIEIKEEASGPA